ncbi:putative cyclin-D6-1 [Mangifera indica]|uniref:putative cyclin-D6-1 n=1 Tax=Mangifera indica TaxID=29780 RepID=UPI001CF9CA07|nr:putative cyclin-D6-1 [Mangifera indica]
MDFDLENPFTSLEEQQSDKISHLFASESDHMPSSSFIQCLKFTDFYVSFRQEAVSLILQAQFSCNFEPSILYLAVTYLDRFIFRQEIPQGKPWVLRLLVTSCISLAAKMKNTQFSPSKVQGEEGFIFDVQTIQRMEHLILDALNWRMRSITPFPFLCYFISLFKLKDPPLTEALRDRASDIIFNAHNEIKLLEFKPSVIAASALLLSSHELFPLQFPSFKTSISSCEYINKENLLECFETMQEMVAMEVQESVIDAMSSTRTPVSVLDYKFSKSASEKIDSNRTTTATFRPEKRDIKRRKKSGFSSESKFQLSRIQQC